MGSRDEGMSVARGFEVRVEGTSTGRVGEGARGEGEASAPASGADPAD
jgi:hypothetical protein